MRSIGRWLGDASVPEDATRFAWVQLALDTVALLGLVAVLAWIFTLPTL